MPRSGALCLGAAAAGVLLLQRPAFVPAPTHRAQKATPVSAAAAAAAAGSVGFVATAPPALADGIGDASKKLADASYPLIQQIDWARSPALNKWLSSAADGWSPGKEIAQAVHSTLKLGTLMDMKLVGAAVAAHEKAVTNAADKPGLVTPLEDHAAVTEAIARMFASAPNDKVKAVFDTYSKVGLKAINRDWFASVNPSDAKAAYRAFFDLQTAVHDKTFDPVSSTQALPDDPNAFVLAPPVYTDKLGAAAKDLADASYPLIQKINWESSPVLTKWLSGASAVWEPAKIATAVNSALKASAAMDPKLIRQAVGAHDKAVLDAINKPGLVTPLEDHEAVTESIARMLASAPPDTVKAVFDTFAEVGLKDLNGQWFSTLNSQEAESAYASFLALKDVVQAGR